MLIEYSGPLRYWSFKYNQIKNLKWPKIKPQKKAKFLYFYYWAGNIDFACVAISCN